MFFNFKNYECKSTKFFVEKESLFYRFFLYQQLMITRLVFSKSKLFCTFAPK